MPRLPDTRRTRTPEHGARSHPSAYVAGLTMLDRRELSEAQVRQRLARREYDPDAIDEAIARLKDERAIDDARVARAIARTAGALKRRGRLRVTREVEQAGIRSSIAKEAVDEAFGDVGEDALLNAALSRRLRGHTDADVDEATRARLYRYLIAQGFQHDRVMRCLTALRRK